jgi:hypothetical protein
MPDRLHIDDRIDPPERRHSGKRCRRAHRRG